MGYAAQQFTRTTGFVTGRKWFNKSLPTIGQQTVAEMKAYCRVTGIPAPASGAWLAKQEFSTGPHPQSYAATRKYDSTPQPTRYIAGQREMFK